MSLTDMEAKSNHGTSVCHCEVAFDGLLSRTTCSSIGIEFFKYILSQREQIPERLDSLIKRLNSQELSNPKVYGVDFERFDNVLPLSVNCHIPNISGEAPGPLLKDVQTHANISTDRTLGRPYITQASSKKSLKSQSTAANFNRRQKLSIRAGETIVKQLQSAFQQSEYPIQKMAILIGSSIITPRETFILTFPQNWINGDPVSQEDVKKNFFRQLVTSDFIGSFADTSLPPLQKIFIFIQTWREANLDWFTADPRFRIPNRGKLYNILIENGSPVDDSIVNRSTCSTMEISGIDPLDITSEQPFKKPRLSNINSLADQNITLDSTIEELSDLEDVIWFRAPIVFTGFRLKRS